MAITNTRTFRGHWLSQTCPKLTTCPSGATRQLVVLAIPGLNEKMFQKKRMASLEKLEQCGGKINRLRPVYPAESVPNAYSIVTGS